MISMEMSEIMPGNVCDGENLVHFFFYKKQVYKKLEPQIGPKNKKIFENFKGLN